MIVKNQFAGPEQVTTAAAVAASGTRIGEVRSIFVINNCNKFI